MLLWWTLRKLKSTDELKRVKAVKTIGNTKNKLVTELLASLLEDNSYLVRIAAAEALGNKGDARGLAHLRGLLNHHYVYVSLAAIEAISRLGHEQSVGSLVSLLQNFDKNVRDASAKALEQIASPEADKALAENRLRIEPRVKQELVIEERRKARARLTRTSKIYCSICKTELLPSDVVSNMHRGFECVSCCSFMCDGCIRFTINKHEGNADHYCALCRSSNIKAIFI